MGFRILGRIEMTTKIGGAIMCLENGPMPLHTLWARKSTKIALFHTISEIHVFCILYRNHSNSQRF